MSNCKLQRENQKTLHALAGSGWLRCIILGASALIASKALGDHAVSGIPSVPLFFEPLSTQTQSSAPQGFVARGHNYHFLITPTEAQMALRRVATATPFSPLERDQLLEPQPLITRALRMELLGANAGAVVQGLGEMPGKINYLIGNDRNKWRTGVATFARVQVKQVYPGIDMVYYGNEHRLEYDFSVAPHADPRAIAIHFTGAKKIEISPAGELVVTLADEEIRQPRPEIYQIVQGGRKPVTGGYQLRDAQTVQFQLGDYDRDLPLIIDPLLSYSTYFGGNAGDIALAIKVDKYSPQGCVFIAGETLSTQFTFPIPAGAFQRTFAGGSINGDAFVAKLGNTATNLVYFTYLGGSGNDGALDLALDTNGNAYVTGFTDSSNFPVLNALYPHIAGTPDPTLHVFRTDAFVTELNTNGSGLVYSTYLGGDAADVAGGIAVDPSGNAYITGYTFSTNFPTHNPLPSHGSTLAGSNDVFVAKIGPGGSPLVYSTYLGGTNADEGEGIAVDAAGFAYVTGFTASTNFPMINALQTNINHSTNAVHDFRGKSVPYDAFVAKLATNGSSLVYSTYLGGTNVDAGFRITCDLSGNAYVVGQAGSSDFTNTLNFPHAANNTNVDAFLTKISSNGLAFMYSALFGGSNNDVAWGVAVDPAGNASVVGITASVSQNFPAISNVTNLRSFNSGALDAFVAGFNANGAMIYSGFFGGATNDYGYAIDVDFGGNAYVAGRTLSTNFPVASAFPNIAPFQSSLNSSNDAFVAKILVEPTLITTAQGNSTVQVMWRAFIPKFQLESNTSLSASNGWTAVLVPPVVINGAYTVTVTNVNVPTFFRLRSL